MSNKVYLTLNGVEYVGDVINIKPVTAGTVPPVTPPVTPPVVPPSTPPATNYNYTELPASGLMGVHLAAGQTLYFTRALTGATKYFTVTMASVDQQQDCNMLITSDAANIDKFFDDAVALYNSNPVWWGYMMNLPKGSTAPTAWCQMSKGTSGETVTRQANMGPIPARIWGRITNTGTATATFNLGVTAQ